MDKTDECDRLNCKLHVYCMVWHRYLPFQDVWPESGGHCQCCPGQPHEPVGLGQWMMV